MVRGWRSLALLISSLLHRLRSKMEDCITQRQTSNRFIHMTTCRLTRMINPEWAKIIGQSSIICSLSHDPDCDFYLSSNGANYKPQLSSSRNSHSSNNSDIFNGHNSPSTSSSSPSASPSSPFSPLEPDEVRPCPYAVKQFGEPHRGTMILSVFSWRHC